MKRVWLRRLVGGLSFTSALFVFQACYGTPHDFGEDILVAGQVKSKSSGLPIKGIRVSVTNNAQYQLTDDNGLFSFYTERLSNLTLQFEDVDEAQNGQYSSKDTLVNSVSDTVKLEIVLDEK